MNILEELNEKLWLADIKTKYEPPEGLFTKSAKEIAIQLKKDSKDLKQSMSRLSFYINRSGKNLDKETLKRLNRAKDVLRKLYGGNELGKNKLK